MSGHRIDDTRGKDLPELLRRLGLRATGPRLAILGALRRDMTHPTPERVLDRVRESYPSLSLSTVYQTLETFIAAGLCRKVAAADGRLRIDGTAADHDHAICRRCGRILDVPVPQDRDPRPALPRGTRLIAVRIEYDVVCARCAARKPE